MSTSWVYWEICQIYFVPFWTIKFPRSDLFVLESLIHLENDSDAVHERILRGLIE